MYAINQIREFRTIVSKKDLNSQRGLHSAGACDCNVTVVGSIPTRNTFISSFWYQSKKKRGVNKISKTYKSYKTSYI